MVKKTPRLERIKEYAIGLLIAAPIAIPLALGMFLIEGLFYPSHPWHGFWIWLGVVGS